MTFFKTHSQLFLHFQHSPNLDPKYLFKKKVPRPNRCRMFLPFLHRHMSLIPPLRHLDSHFSYRAKGPSMSCDRQRQKSESAQHFSKRVPNFFCTSDIHQTWIQNIFSKKSSSPN